MISLIFRDGIEQKVPGVSTDMFQRALSNQATANTKFLRIGNVIINLNQLQEVYGEPEEEKHG